MKLEKIPTILEVNVLDVDAGEVNPVLSEELIEELSKNFGKGIRKRRMLVSKGVTLKEIYNLSRE